MQKLYCWRCKAEVAMLDETEFKTVAAFFPEGIAATVVNGHVTLENGQATGSVPGQLLRGPGARMA